MEGGSGRCIYLGDSVSVMDHLARGCACNVLLERALVHSQGACTAGRVVLSFPAQSRRCLVHRLNQ